MDKQELKALIREVLQEKLGSTHGVLKAALPQISVGPQDRMDTGDAAHQVYTHDLFSLQQSPRLGTGIMEMRQTTFPWTLHYDEIDYVIEGELSILIDGQTITAGPGEVILIPKDSSISFSVPNFARFLYVTYPADWQQQA